MICAAVDAAGTTAVAPGLIGITKGVAVNVLSTAGYRVMAEREKLRSVRPPRRITAILMDTLVLTTAATVLIQKMTTTNMRLTTTNREASLQNISQNDITILSIHVYLPIV